jgi:hypothetical protein
VETEEAREGKEEGLGEGREEEDSRSSGTLMIQHRHGDTKRRRSTPFTRRHTPQSQEQRKRPKKKRKDTDEEA